MTREEAMDLIDNLILWEEAIDKMGMPTLTREQQQEIFANMIMAHIDGTFYDGLKK